MLRGHTELLRGHHARVSHNEHHNNSLKVWIFDKPEEFLSPVCWLVDFGFQRLVESYLLHLYPRLLLLRDEHVSKLFLFLDCVEVVNDHSHEKVDDKLGSYNHKRNEVDASEAYVLVLFGLQMDAPRVHPASEYINPSLSCSQLK